MPVPHQCQPSAGLVGDGEQSPGGVLVEHPGLVDEQDVTGQQPGFEVRIVWFDSGPAAVVVPSEAVLVGQPRRRERVPAQLPGRDRGRLARRGHHHQGLRWSPSRIAAAAPSVVVLPAPAAPSITSSRPVPANASQPRLGLHVIESAD